MVYCLLESIWRNVVVTDVTPAYLFAFVFTWVVSQLTVLALAQSYGPHGRYAVLHIHQLLLLGLLACDVVLESVWIGVLHSHRALSRYGLLL
jgi:hypothetical protein